MGELAGPNTDQPGTSDESGRVTAALAKVQRSSATQIVDLLSRLSGALLGDPLSERSRGRQKALVLCTIAGALVAISGAGLSQVSVFGLTFGGVNKQTLAYSLAVALFGLLVFFQFSIYLDVAARQFTRLSAEMEIAAAMNALNEYLRWEEPDAIRFNQTRSAYANKVYADLQVRRTLGGLLTNLMKRRELDIKAVHEKYGSNMYDGINLDAMNFTDVASIASVMNELAKRSTSSMQGSDASLVGQQCQEQGKDIIVELTQEMALLDELRAIEEEYEPRFDDIMGKLNAMPMPDSQAMIELGDETLHAFITIQQRAALLESAIKSSVRIRRIAAMLESGLVSLAALIVIISLAFQAWQQG